jgi:diguanylate cyclase (GGDEF)-like protein
MVLAILEIIILAFVKELSLKTTLPLLLVISLTCTSFLNLISAHVKVLRIGENSLRDPLTQLPNRRAFFDRLKQLWGQEFVLALLDLNKFKEINDSFGHYTGDQVLVLVTQRLSKYLPADSMLARLGGDEFALIAPISAQESLELLHLTANAFSYPFIVDGESFEVGISMGYAHFTPESFENVELNPTLALERVDEAMYLAKKSGITISNWRNESSNY